MLALCAAHELDAAVAPLCAEASGDPRRDHPTFGLALAAFPGAHWSALSPGAPLRWWRLVHREAGTSIATSPLRIDERVLHHVTDLWHLDDVLEGLLAPLDDRSPLSRGQAEVADRVVRLLVDADVSAAPVVALGGRDPDVKRAIAGRVGNALGARVHVLDLADAPTAAHERDTFHRSWTREVVLSGGVLFIDARGADGSEDRDRLRRLVRDLPGAVLVAAREPPSAGDRRWVRVDVPDPTAAERRDVWRAAIDADEPIPDDRLAPIVDQFVMGPAVVAAAAAAARARGRGGMDPDHLWDACREQVRPAVDGLAERVPTVARWDDLVLPERQRVLLRQLAAHVRQRRRVQEDWGFGARSARGHGLAALFCGASGTGKTMAAEVLANELQLDLYRIDLSRVVDKYVGETEKNLRRVFDAAEPGGGILLFDEADALFGSRTEARTAHDRWANIEVSYLLQRMEAYRGLAVLTTNMRDALDTAFLRRLRFVVEFPFPGADERAEIWRRVFPPETPTEGLDVGRLSKLGVAGGNIRNIALHAAFLAAEDGSPVRMEHIADAARTEYEKIGRPATDLEAVMSR